MPKPRTPNSSSAAIVGYEAQLWQMADALRGSMDAAEYKHVVLRFIFLPGQQNLWVESGSGSRPSV